MQIRKNANIIHAAAVVAKRPMFVLGAEAIAQVSGGGPNGGWSPEVAAHSPASGASASGALQGAGGPNGGWSVVAGGPNGGW